MSDISSGSIDINLHTGDDGSGRGPDGDMKVVIETLRNVQNSVATISQNVRAILDTLRTIARNGGMGRERASRSATETSSRSSRVTVERRPAYDPRKALAIRSSMPDFSWVSSGVVSSPAAEELQRRRAREASRTLMLTGVSSLALRGSMPDFSWVSSEDPYSPFKEAVNRWRAAKNAPLSGGGLAVLNNVNRQRQMQGLARIASPQSSTAMISRGYGIGMSKIPSIPLLAGPGAPAGDLVLAAQTAGGMTATGTPAPPAPPSPPGPPPSAPPRSQPGGESWMSAFKSIGRILATLSLIGSAVKTVISMIKFFPDLARQQRSELARVDPVIAQYQAQAMIANLQDRIIMGRDPGMRAAYAGFTQSEMSYLQSTRTIRMQGRQFVAGMGQSVNEYLGGFGLIYEGLLSGDFGKIGAGIDAFNIFTGGTLYRSYTAMKLAQQGNTLRSIFIGDLVGMTGGRFSTNIAYPGSAPNNAPPAWWNSRP
jgi:hypothetical protein